VILWNTRKENSNDIKPTERNSRREKEVPRQYFRYVIKA
jgi:hypothetical protein